MESLKVQIRYDEAFGFSKTRRDIIVKVGVL